MPIPHSKSELIAAFLKESQKLMSELQSIPPEMSRETSIDVDLSACDIVAYQIGWGELLIGWYSAGKNGIMPALPAENYKWNQLGALAKHFYRTFEKEEYDVLIKRLQGVIAQVYDMINENTNEQLYTLNIYNWTGDKWPLGRWINVNTSSPYASACAKIRKWKKRQGLA